MQKIHTFFYVFYEIPHMENKTEEGLRTEYWEIQRRLNFEIYCYDVPYDFLSKMNF